MYKLPMCMYPKRIDLNSQGFTVNPGVRLTTFGTLVTISKLQEFPKYNMILTFEFHCEIRMTLTNCIPWQEMD